MMWERKCLLMIACLVVAVGCGDESGPDEIGTGRGTGGGGSAGSAGTAGTGGTAGTAGTGGMGSAGNDGSSECGGAGPSTTGLDAEEQSFLELLNQHRASNGRDPVSACTSLNRAAQGHSEDMRDQNYFDHEGLNGSSPIERACEACYLSCESTGWGENIAAGNSGAAGTFDQWVNSPGHNQNMLGSGFEVVGIGRATGGGRFGTYWTTVFGGRSDESCQ